MPLQNRSTPPRARGSWLRALLTGLIVALGATPATYLIGVTVSPPVTADGHRVMPIAQVGFALLVGPLLGIVTGVLVAYRRRK